MSFYHSSGLRHINYARTHGSASSENTGSSQPKNNPIEARVKISSPSSTTIKGIRLMIHTLIVDNDMLFRAGIRMMIDSSSDITVAGEATTGLEALDMIQTTNVDIVLMDISIPQLNGVEATKKSSTFPIVLRFSSLPPMGWMKNCSMPLRPAPQVFYSKTHHLRGSLQLSHLHTTAMLSFRLSLAHHIGALPLSNQPSHPHPPTSPPPCASTGDPMNRTGTGLTTGDVGSARTRRSPHCDVTSTC